MCIDMRTTWSETISLLSQRPSAREGGTIRVLIHEPEIMLALTDRLIMSRKPFPLRD